MTFTPGCSTYSCESFNDTEVASAVAAADAIIVALGTTVTNGVIPGSPCEYDQLAVEAEGWDRAGTALPGQQLALLQASTGRLVGVGVHVWANTRCAPSMQTAVAAARKGTPVTLVLINAGGALSLGYRRCSALHASQRCAGMLDIGWALASPGVTSILHAPMLGMTSGTAIGGASCAQRGEGRRVAL